MRKPKKRPIIYLIFGLILCGIFIFFFGILAGEKYSINKTSLIQPKIGQKATSTKESFTVSGNTDKLKDTNQIKEEITFYKTLSDEDKSIKKESAKIKNMAKRGERERDKKAFTVQVGSFKRESEALKLRSMLKEKGYDVYIVNFNDSEGTVWYRVRIGSYNNKIEAYSIAEKIEKNEGLSNFVIKKSK